MTFRRPLGVLLTTLLVLLSTPLSADYTLNMTQGVTEVSHRIFDLHMTVIYICIAIGVLVYGAMLWIIVRHRKSKHAVAASFHESTLVEIIWTIIPFFILIGMAAPATYTLIFMHDTEDADLSIVVTGYRWYWHYDYMDEGVSFFSYLSTPEDEIKNFAPKNKNYLLEVDNHLVVPVGKKIRFLITSKDVIHSWWVPQLAVKKDAIPGFINDSWAKIDVPGIYRGQCAELCGVQHGFMPIVVEAKSEQEYQEWLTSKKQTKTAHVHDMTKM